MSKLLISATVFTIMLAACTKNNFEKEHPPVVTPPPIANPTPTPTALDPCKDSIKYSTVIKSLVSTNCSYSGCHDGNAQIDFNDYTTLSSDSSSILLYIVDATNPMPKSGLMSDCNISKLKTWIKAGAPNN